MEIPHRQQFRLPVGQPVPCRCPLAFWAVAVTATIVGDQRVSARGVLATRNMTAERCRPATLDGAHRLQLVEAHMADVGMTPRRTVAAENIRNLQGRPGHSRLRRALPALLGLAGQHVQRALNVGDHAGSDTCVTRRRLQLVVTEQRLDLANIDTTLQQMRRKAVAQ